MFELKKEFLETHEALLTVEVDKKTFEKEMKKATRTIARQVDIPGFRPGKAPYHIVLRRIGEEAVYQRVAESLMNEVYPQAVEQAEISPYASGELEDLQFDPLVYQFRVPLKPEVDLGDYRSLRLDYTEPEVTDAEMEAALEQVRLRNTVRNEVDRAAQLDDEVTISIKADVDGEPLIDEDEINVVLDGGKVFIASGFVQALVGLSKGEEKTFELTLPDDLEQESLRGQAANFTVEVLEVYERHLPDLDDALASAVGPYETLAELKTDLRETALSRKRSEAKQAYHINLLEALVEQAEVKYPPLMLEEQIDGMVENVRENVKREHQLDLEDALRLQAKTMEDLREDLRPNAEVELEQTLVISQFINQEDIKVGDEEVKQHFEALLTEAGIDSDEALNDLDLHSSTGRQVRYSALQKKVFEHLEKIAQGELDSETPSEPEAEATGASGSEDAPVSSELESEPEAEEMDENQPAET